jgi:hypothetical protein
MSAVRPQCRHRAGIILAVVLLILIISFGAIVAISLRQSSCRLQLFRRRDGSNCSHAAATGKQE